MQAWYLDFQNLHANRHRAEFGPRSYSPRLDPQPVLLNLPGLAACLTRLFGPVKRMKAYADWGPFGAYAPALNRCLFEAVQVPSTRSGKNAADIALAVDAVLEAGADPEVRVVVVGSNDSDFSQLALRLRRMGKTVVGLGVAGSPVSDLFRAACDQFLFYPNPLRPVLSGILDEGSSVAAKSDSAGQNTPPPHAKPDPRRPGRRRKGRRQSPPGASPMHPTGPSANGTPGQEKT